MSKRKKNAPEFKVIAGYAAGEFARVRGRGRARKWDLSQLAPEAKVFVEDYVAGMPSATPLDRVKRLVIRGFFEWASAQPHHGDLASLTRRDWDDYQAFVRGSGTRPGHHYRRKAEVYHFLEAAMVAGVRPRTLGNPIPPPRDVKGFDAADIPTRLRPVFDGWSKYNQRRAQRRIDTQGQQGIAPRVAQQRDQCAGHFLLDAASAARDRGSAVENPT